LSTVNQRLNGRSLYHPTNDVSPSPLNVSLNVVAPEGLATTAERVTSGILAAA
jgi:hypothetical protein